MKKALTLFLILNGLLLGLLGGLALLAETCPYQPGDPLYPVQVSAESWRLRLTADTTTQANMALDLVEHRLTDLAIVNTPAQMTSVAVALDEALNIAIPLISSAPAGAQPNLTTRLDNLLIQANTVLNSLEPAGDTPAGFQPIAALRLKIGTLQTAETPAGMVAMIPQEIPGAPVTFFELEIDHDSYPLTGQHSGLDCLACHADGRYVGTPTTCRACHDLPASDLYPNHFPGQSGQPYACENCHTVDNWQTSAFDHAGVTECESCHTADLTETHYPDGPTCLACHSNTNDWARTSFAHLGVRECESCHLADTPEAHYPGACLACHQDLADWSVSVYRHRAVSEC